jgi:hypothetical protein
LPELSYNGVNEHLLQTAKVHIKQNAAEFVKKGQSGRSAAPEAKHGCEAAKAVVHGSTPAFGRGLHPTGCVLMELCRIRINRLYSLWEVRSFFGKKIEQRIFIIKRYF